MTSQPSCSKGQTEASSAVWDHDGLRYPGGRNFSPARNPTIPTPQFSNTTARLAPGCQDELGPECILIGGYSSVFLHMADPHTRRFPLMAELEQRGDAPNAGRHNMAG
ncbi:hypothetical protein CISG_05110 [Coccidioides immitis RMSCC 3703]|uniref:Uncharacterized protein n=2 Tax=Coccidioides immitis TaxID=5501 RepID=A0A0J8TP12_COCIT|nr:hypothetical protein CIRG_01382 [Coccidioides immitis RMSCC 2394]KMU75477.1 hypothetical protein CISG_05110 [Coccidioides immitis RMSCC 3703]